MYFSIKHIKRYVYTKTTVLLPDMSTDIVTNPTFKISISSHVGYTYALNVLLNSFDRHDISRKDVIVTICGREGEPPEIIETDPDREVIIYVPRNCYEMSHVYGVSCFIDHPRVKADYYITIHDTSLATEKFQDCMKIYANEMKKRDLDVLYALQTRQLNLAGFSYAFMKEHGHNYNKDIDKPAAWDAEHGGTLSYQSFVPPERVGQFECGFKYESGMPLYSDIVRHPIYIASMGIVKFVANNDNDINPPWQDRQRP